jgi:hypothetical protein
MGNIEVAGEFYFAALKILSINPMGAWDPGIMIGEYLAKLLLGDVH